MAQFHEFLPQVITLLVVMGVSFGWGVAMTKKQDKEACKLNHDSFTHTMGEIMNELSLLKVELTRLQVKIESLESQLNRVEVTIERHSTRSNN